LHAARTVSVDKANWEMGDFLRVLEKQKIILVFSLLSVLHSKQQGSSKEFIDTSLHCLLIFSIAAAAVIRAAAAAFEYNSALDAFSFSSSTALDPLLTPPPVI
jgi:hypothetical protein